MTYVDPDQRYRLDSKIATGGMGVVWRGTDTVLNREVAIKVLKPEYAEDPQFRSRFETEARHAAALHHPGVAAVFDFGEGVLEDGPRPYLVMELVDGQPLSNLLRPHAPMDPAVARELMALTADALAAAHAAGIVHRDIKPANLMVLPDRRVKITDFGIARAADGLALTATGQVMGTPQYLSPEQAEGGTATFASDIYSLGVVAFECLAGYRPFAGETPVTTALAHLREPVPELPAQVPNDLARVVRRAMSKKPADRYGSAAEFATALRNPSSVPDRVVPVVPVPAPGPATAVMPAVTEPVSVPARSEERDSRVANPWPWVLLAVVAIVAVVALVVSQTGGDEAPINETSPSPSVSSPTEETSTPSSPTAPAVVSVNPADYIGRNVDDVAQELRELGLRVATVRVDNPGGETADDVQDVSPAGDLNEGDQVTVSYWGAAPTEPTEPTTPPTTEPTSPATSETTSAAEPAPSTTPTGARALSGQKNGKVNHR